MQAIGCLVAPSFVQTVLLGAPMEGPGAFLWLDLWGFVVIMGLGSALVAWDPVRNRGVAVVSALGKTTAAAHWLVLVALGSAPAALAVGAVGDGLLGLAMFAWLAATRERVRGARNDS